MLYEFTSDFFTYFGAKVKKSRSKKNPSLSISLPENLAERFGKESMKLVFDPAQVDRDNELVASGSRIFDQMLLHLNECGALTLQKLPIRFSGGEALMQAVRPLNATVSKLKMSEQQLHLYLFNWRIVYRADDKREMLYTVALDENGHRLALNNESIIDERSIDTATLLADAEAIALESNEDGKTLPPKLPPMTRLTELAESARKFAIYHADLQCASLESEIQPRLYKSLNRLHSYYRQQIEEVYDTHDPDGEKRRLLELDLQRKLAEEVENHRLRIQVELFSYAILQIPVAVADISLHDGRQEVAIAVQQNRYTGAMQRPLCHACEEEISNVLIDHNGHVTCENCLEQCANCLNVYCTVCAVHACPVCEKSNCEECSQFCWACGERGCQEHTSQCPICFDTVCYSCQSECAECGVRQCISHLRTDAVAVKVPATELNESDTEEEIHRLICGSCAVRCGGCQQFSAQIDLCESSGQRFCLNCLGTCVDCGKTVGPDYYHVNPGDRQIYCMDCLKTCPTCQQPTVEVIECHSCSTPCCTQCNHHCLWCHQLFCSDHANRVEPCGHVFCTEHGATCAIGHEPVCPICDETCAICSLHYCEQHTATCELCRMTFCQECVRPGLKLCDTCATIHEDGVAVNLSHEPIANNRDVAPLLHKYQWRRAGNERHTVYLGQGRFNSGALILTQRVAHEEEVIVVRKLSALDRYWKKYT